jgi:hypothetical protein
MKDLQMYFQCWVEVTKQSCYRDKWLTDETYFQVIKFCFLPLIPFFIEGNLNRAISMCGGATLDNFLEGNKTDMFRRTEKGIDPFGNPSRSIWGYFVTTPDLFSLSGSKLDSFSGLFLLLGYLYLLRIYFDHQEV